MIGRSAAKQAVKENIMINIAIDGPAGAGKSTLARYAAQQLGYIYVDTGALYRAVALYMLQRKIDVSNAVAVAAALTAVDVQLKFIDGEQRVYLCGENVSSVIRTPEVSMAASNVSAIAKVREFLFDLQQSIAMNNNVIMDGRDIGTMVLPEAQVKIFLTASPEERAQRRFDELTAKGMQVEYKDVLADVKLRDYNDSTRAIAPLRPAEDSVTVDTTGLTLEAAENVLLEVIKNKLGK